MPQATTTLTTLSGSGKNPAAMANIRTVVDKIFETDSQLFLWEFCDYMEKIKPTESYKMCDSSAGFYGVDSPMSLLSSVLDELSPEVEDIVLMNGDFVGHMASNKDWQITVNKKWKANLKIINSVFLTIRLKIPNTTFFSIKSNTQSDF